MFDAYPCTHTTGQKLSSGTISSTAGASLQQSLEVCCHFPLLAELSRSRPAPSQQQPAQAVSSTGTCSQGRTGALHGSRLALAGTAQDLFDAGSFQHAALLQRIHHQEKERITRLSVCRWRYLGLPNSTPGFSFSVPRSFLMAPL